MTSSKLITALRPQHGCARCYFWDQHVVDNWGYCSMTRSQTWWQCGPCAEYEMDQDRPDVIKILDTPDEIHDSHRH